MVTNGWICPRCGLVNAPQVAQCTCQPDRVQEAMRPTLPADASPDVTHTATPPPLRWGPGCRLRPGKGGTDGKPVFE